MKDISFYAINKILCTYSKVNLKKALLNKLTFIHNVEYTQYIVLSFKIY